MDWGQGLADQIYHHRDIVGLAWRRRVLFWGGGFALFSGGAGEKIARAKARHPCGRKSFVH